MAELNYGKDDLDTAIAEFNYVEDESDQGIPSPVDCWELIGSIPSSPLPEASGDVSALEEAMAITCDTGGSLQDEYFGCTHISADTEVLPVSTVMAERQIEDEGHSESADEGQASKNALVSLDSDTDAIESCATPSSLSPITDHVHHDDLMCHDNYMQHDDDHPYDNSPVRHDVRAHHGDTRQSKMDDEYCMSHNGIMEHVEGWHIEDNVMCTDEKHGHCSADLCEVAGSTAVANAHHDVCASTPSSPLDDLASPSYVRMSSHDMEDSYMNIQQSFVQGSNRNVNLNESGGNMTGHANQTQDSVDVQHGTVSAFNSRHHKGLTCASWIWTQLIRWQAQLGCANTIWSVALAAAVMGLLVLGRGWQRLQGQNRTLRTQLWAKEQRITQLMFQLMQTKDSLSKIRRVPVICVKPSLQIPQGHV